MTRKSLLGAAFVAGLSIAGNLYAEESAPQGQPPAESVTLVAYSPNVWNSSWWGERRFVPRIGYRYDTGSSIGRIDGLSSFQGFVPLWENFDSTQLSFSDARVLLFDRGGYAAVNTGVGHRIYNENLNRILGGYLYYDNQNTGNFTFSQISGGVESLGELFDVRSNFYVPVGTDRKYTSGYYAVQFVGNNLFLGRNAQAAMTGFDAEIGALLYDSGTAAYRIYAGLYDFQVSGSQQAWGWKSRVQANILDNVTLGLSVQTDNVFNTTVNFSTAVYFPRHSARRRETPRNEPIAVADRLAEPIERIQNMVIANQRGADRTIAIDPNTGLPLFFLHVAAGGASDGSIGDPYGTLAEAFADPRFTAGNVIVYDRTAGTYNGNLTLQANTQILSNGPVQTVGTQVGQVVLPLSGVSPSRLSTINGDGSQAAITLANGANHVVLGGVHVDGANNDGVAIEVGGTVDGLTIRDGLFTNVNIGVNLNPLGLGGVTGDVAIANNSINGSLAEGIFIALDHDAAANITIANNSIQNAGADAIRFDVNTTVGFTSAVANYLIEGNTIATPTGNGVSVTVGNGITAVTTVARGSIINNSISNAGGSGIVLLSDGVSNTAPTLFAVLTDNQLANNTNSAVSAATGSNGGYLNLTANGNVASGAGANLDCNLSNTNSAGTFFVTDIDTLAARNNFTVNLSPSRGDFLPPP